MSMDPGDSQFPTGASRNDAILITGANGEVGHGLIRALHARGDAQIIAIDIREIDSHLKPMVTDAFVGDICDTFLLARLLSMYRITRIFHLAAMLSTRAEYAPETAHDVNVTGTMNLLRLASEQARSHGETVRFIYPSSIAVYGLRTIERKREAGAVEEGRYNSPTTMYGCNKLYGEHLGRYYSNHYRQLSQDRSTDALDFRCLRYPGLISAETLPTGGTSDFGPEMLHAAAAGRHYSCFVRPDTRIPFMTMPAAIRATLELADADPKALTRNVYNVSAFAPSADEFASAVQSHFPDADISYEPDHQRQGIVDQWPEDVNCSRAQADWGFDPREDISSAFADYLVPAIRARYANA